MSEQTNSSTGSSSPPDSSADSPASEIPGREALLAAACEQAGLDDFGELWFGEHIDRLVDALNTESRLSAAGAMGAQGMIVNAMVNRLRHVELVKNNPQICDIAVNVAAIVVGLPRTGSTMMHRMLAAAPGMTGVKWYEAQNYAPFPGEQRGDPSPRRAAAEGILGYMLEQIPELMSIHPMSIDQPDEEVIILGQLFSSTMIESTYYVPGYTKWLVQQDRVQAYRDLKQILQALVWQLPEREGAAWVLKTPGHLMALDAAMSVFPDAKIVMTHRDPVSTVPSYCSMEDTLYRMGSADISHQMIGDYWFDRLHDLVSSFMDVRAAAEGNADESKFVDIRYPDLLANPVAEGERVLQAIGIGVDDEIRASMQEWIEANKREDRAPHKYDLSDFGLTKDSIQEKFAAYTKRFL